MSGWAGWHGLDVLGNMIIYNISLPKIRKFAKIQCTSAERPVSAQYIGIEAHAGFCQS